MQLLRLKRVDEKLINAQELSANIKTGMPKVLSALNINYPDEDAIDVLPCTNMISGGSRCGSFRTHAYL